MADAKLLQIGTVDMSQYALRGQIRIDKTPVYDESQSFVNVLGQTVRTYLGDRISLSASFEDLPYPVVSAVQTACASDVSMTFLNPGEVTAVFERPAVSTAVEWEKDANTQYWSLSISAECTLLNGGSL